MAISLTKTAFLTAAMTVAPLASAFAQTVLTPAVGSCSLGLLLKVHSLRASFRS